MRTHRFTLPLLILGAVNLVGWNFGPIAPRTSGAIGAACLLILWGMIALDRGLSLRGGGRVLSEPRPSGSGSSYLRPTAICALAGGALSLAAIGLCDVRGVPGPPGLACVCLNLFCLSHAMKAGAPSLAKQGVGDRSRLPAPGQPTQPHAAATVKAAGYTALAYLIVLLVLQHVPAAWNAVQNASVALSTRIGRATGTGVVQGASTGGIYVFLSLAVYLAVRTLGAKPANPLALVAGAGWLVALLLAQMAVGPIVAFEAAHALGRLLGSNPVMDPTIGLESAAAAVYSPILLFLAGSLVLVAIEPFCGVNAVAGAPSLAQQGVGDRTRQPMPVGWPIASAVGESNPRGTRAGRRHRLFKAATDRRVLTIILFAVSTIAGVVLYGRQPLWGAPSLTQQGVGDRQSSNNRILFFRDPSDALRDFSVPDFSRFGLATAGMFGLLPRHMATWGLEADMMPPGTLITAPMLADHGAFVVINPTEHFRDDEKRAIWSYVADGGALLVLGDHTDIMGSMAPLNDLLSPVGIRFRFDSAFTPTRWVHAYETFPHEITAGLDAANERLRQSTGASLDIDPTVRPIVSARWGFSDLGNYNNTEDAYLGDYAYQFTERLGDVVVVAEARYGHGRVLVFGDTSAFQNNAIFHSDGFLRNVFTHLVSGGDRPQSLTLAALAALLLVTVLALLLRTPSPRLPAACWIVALPVIGIQGIWPLVSARGTDDLAAEPSSWPIAYVDAAHVNRFSLAPWHDDSIGGLLLNLARNGYVAKVLHEDLSSRVPDAGVLVVIAPTEPFSPAELSAIRSFMADGGLLVVSVGYEEKPGARSLLDMIGVDIGPEPLGPIPVEPPVRTRAIIEQALSAPHFREAWPVVNNAGEPLDSFYRQGAYDIIGFRALGKGGALVIADSWFLLDKTLETEKAYWKGNIDLIRSMFEQLRSRGVGR